jgi:hypothetical protein
VQRPAKKAGPNVDNEPVIVLSEHKLDGVHVNGIDVGPTWRLLYVVMFVNVRVKALPVQDGMHPSVRGVKKNQEQWQRNQCIGNTHGMYMPGQVIPAVPEEQVGKGRRIGLAESDAQYIHPT